MRFLISEVSLYGSGFQVAFMEAVLFMYTFLANVSLWAQAGAKEQLYTGTFHCARTISNMEGTLPNPCRVASLKRNQPLLEPYSRPMPRAL